MPVATPVSLIPDSQGPSGLEALFSSATCKSVGIRLLLPWSKEIPKLQLGLLGFCLEGRLVPPHTIRVSVPIIFPFVFSFSQA